MCAPENFCVPVMDLEPLNLSCMPRQGHQQRGAPRAAGAGGFLVAL